MDTVPTLVTSAILLVLIQQYAKRRAQLPLPPGPRKLPIIGNLLSIPRDRVAKTYHEWSKHYDSDIIHLEGPTQSIIVLNSLAMANDLLEQRSASYSSRLLVPMQVLMGLTEWHVAHIPYGDAWRARRRLFHHALNENTVKVYRPQLTQASRQLLRDLLDTPNEFIKHVKYFVAKTVVDITYGLDIKSPDDPVFQLVHRVNSNIAEVTLHGKYLVDLIPVLKYVPGWVPGAEFQTVAKSWRRAAQELLETPFKAAKKAIADGTALPSFTANNLRDIDGVKGDKQEYEKLVSEVAGAMYGAGSDTTAALLLSTLLALVLNPEVMKKAQRELDEVIRPGELPTFEDMDELPYLNAVLMEALRWSATGPLGVPHLVETEDVYQGYRIPKNTIVIANAYGIMRDERLFANPEAFDPERYLKDGKLRTDKDMHDPRKLAFGFGRRICPGRHLAYNSAWISLASILTVFNVDPLPGDVPPALFNEDGAIRYPLPYQCLIKPRSERATQTVASV